MNEPKQVIVMRKDLNMRKGKMVAQGAHASMKVFFDVGTIDQHNLVIPLTQQMQIWVEGNFKKICLGIDSENALVELYEKAREVGLPCAMIVDSGLTEFNGVPTKTCIAIGPDLAEKIDKITGELKPL